MMEPQSVRGIGVESVDMLVHEVFSHELRDELAGLTGSPDESGAQRQKWPGQGRQRASTFAA
jgi:hypothetical protein